MEKDIELQDYIRRYQQEDDQECLQLLLEHCWPYVETLIGELAITTEMNEDFVRKLRQKEKTRFSFIAGPTTNGSQLFSCSLDTSPTTEPPCLVSPSKIATAKYYS
ncbi:hypothetical protein E4V51_26440 [Paenibacillus sp. 28ISP30-2]|nr:hypothetical protein [Paenibacillus sp. 28ISP30-2]